MDWGTEAWLRSLTFDRVGVRLAFDAVLATRAQRARLDAAITELPAPPVFAPVMGGWPACTGSAR